MLIFSTAILACAVLLNYNLMSIQYTLNLFCNTIPLFGYPSRQDKRPPHRERVLGVWVQNTNFGQPQNQIHDGSGHTTPFSGPPRVHTQLNTHQAQTPAIYNTHTHTHIQYMNIYTQLPEWLDFLVSGWRISLCIKKILGYWTSP